MSGRFARPYAKALLAAAGTTDRGVEAKDRLARFVEATRRVPAIATMASNPAVPRRVKEEVLEEISTLLELGPLVKSMVLLLERNYRLGHVEAVLAAVEETLDRRLGVVRAEVSTAHPLSAEQERKLRTALERKLDQNVKMTVAHDPRLLAGFVARVGSRRYDASLDGQIGRLAATLAGER